MKIRPGQSRFFHFFFPEPSATIRMYGGQQLPLGFLSWEGILVNGNVQRRMVPHDVVKL